MASIFEHLLTGDGWMIDKGIARRRLRSQLISRGKERTPLGVVRRMGAIQAQDYLQVLWAIGLRTAQAKVATIEQAIADRQIVITWAMRGTLHAVPAEDVKWMLGRLAPRILANDQRRLAQLELDSRQMAQCETLIHDALKENKRMQRQHLMDLLERAGIKTKPQRGYHILWYLAQSGLICPGPVEGNQQTFVLLEDWVRNPAGLPLEEAAGELAKRYFAGHGPATLHDFAWWSGLPVKEAREGLEAIQDKLHRETIAGAEFWMDRNVDDAMEGDEGDEITSAVHLLPGYDEYLLGYKDRSAVLDARYAPRIVPGNNGVFAPLVVIDGVISGTWKRTIRKNEVELQVFPFEKIGNLQERIVEASRKYAEFSGFALSRTIIQEV
jgi:hypothetical protein